MNNIILIGAPGSGKGTQGDMLRKELNLLRISPGDIMRAKRSDINSELGKQLNTLLDAGKLMPADIVNKLTFEFIEERISSYSGILFDGYPRSLEQAEFLTKNINPYGQIRKVIFLNVSLDSLIERLMNRYMCKKCGAIYNYKTHNTRVENTCDECGFHEFNMRKDDSEIEIIKTRFEEFTQKTQPVIDLYNKNGILISIDALGNINDIYHNIIKGIE